MLSEKINFTIINQIRRQKKLEAKPTASHAEIGYDLDPSLGDLVLKGSF